MKWVQKSEFEFQKMGIFLICCDLEKIGFECLKVY